MSDNFSISLLFTLKSEGGFSDDPHDPGGATMKGVTLEVYRDYKGNSELTAADLKRITDAEISDIYMSRYWAKVRAEELPDGIDLSVFDMGVNAGPATSIKLLQRALGVTADGIFGPITLAAVSAAAPHALVQTLYQRQITYYRSLSTFKYFGKGWTRRCQGRRQAALALIATVEAIALSPAPAKAFVGNA
jgi:lysozyme family protein